MAEISTVRHWWAPCIANRYLNLAAEESKYATNSNYPVALVKMITCDRSPRIRHLSELTERDWENAVQGQGNIKRFIKRRVFVAIISLRASSPIWAKEPQKACSKAARENLNLQNAPPPKKDAALLLILPATQARPYVRREIVEMQKWCSHGNLISHLSSPNHNCVYLNWDSKSVLNCWFLKEKSLHLRHLLQK